MGSLCQGTIGSAQQVHATNGTKRWGAPVEGGSRRKHSGIMVWTLCNTKPSWCVDETHKTMGNPASVEFSYQTTAALLLKVLARDHSICLVAHTGRAHADVHVLSDSDTNRFRLFSRVHWGRGERQQATLKVNILCVVGNMPQEPRQALPQVQSSSAIVSTKRLHARKLVSSDLV